MLTSFCNGKEKNNKLSLKKTTSPQMKLGDKPNKIGTKIGNSFRIFFVVGAVVVTISLL